jgi:hypothetical protein
MGHIGLSREELDYMQTLIARLDAQEPGAGSERRVRPRIDFSHPLWLNMPTEPGKPWVHILSRNLSTGGLAFLTRQIFYVNQHLVISHELNEKEPLLVLSRVCFCRPVDMRVFEVGLAFVAVEKDPQRVRKVPAHWLHQVMRTDWLARQKLTAVVR